MSTEEDSMLLTALAIIDKLPDAVLQRHHRRLEGTVGRLRRREKKKGTKENLVQSVNKQQKSLSAFFSQAPEAAVSEPTTWHTFDTRVSDVVRCSPTTLWEKFRKGLGERSLAWQFHCWEYKKDRTSRLLTLHSDLNNLNDVRNCRAPAFAKDVGLPDAKHVLNAIYHGTKLLILEGLSRHKSYTPILFFLSSHVRTLHYRDIRDLCKTFERNAAIRSLVKDGAWFDECIAVYEKQCSQTLRLSKGLPSEADNHRLNQPADQQQPADPHHSYPHHSYQQPALQQHTPQQRIPQPQIPQQQIPQQHTPQQHTPQQHTPQQPALQQPAQLMAHYRSSDLIDPIGCGGSFGYATLPTAMLGSSSTGSVQTDTTGQYGIDVLNPLSADYVLNTLSAGYVNLFTLQDTHSSAQTTGDPYATTSASTSLLPNPRS